MRSLSYLPLPTPPQHRQVFSSLSVSLVCYLITSFLPFKDKIFKSNGIRDKTRFLNARFSSVAQSCQTLCDTINHSMPGLPVHYQLLEFIQTHAHWVSVALQPSHPLSSPSPPALNLSQHQGLSNESVLRISWPKYWNFRITINSSSEYSGLISFRMDWLDLPGVQGSLKSLLQHHSSKASIL